MGNCVQQQQVPQRSRSSENLSHSFHRNFLANRLRNIRTSSPFHLNTLIDETLSIIRTVVDTDQEPPHAMLVVSRIASREDRWIEVMMALIDRVPISDPLGATVIALLLDECSLPSRELLHQLIKRICADNRSRMKILQSILDQYIDENRKQLNAIIETDNDGREVRINEVIIDEIITEQVEK